MKFRLLQSRLQLALAIDYAIILSHRFAEEKQTKNAYDAIVTALSKAILEISSSSLTTLAGLAALMVMQLRIGMDMGLVLCKGIICYGVLYYARLAFGVFG